MGKGDKNVPVDDTETRTKKKKKRQTGKRRREIPELNAIKSTAKEMEVKKKKNTKRLLSENSAPEDPPHLGRDIYMKQIIAHSWFAEIVSKLSPA